MVAGGAQKIVLELIRKLPQEQFDIHLLSGVETGKEGSYWPEAENLLPSENIHRIKNLVRAPNPFKDFKAYKKLCQIFKKIRPDIVHTHTSKAGVIGRMAACKMKIPRVVHSTHGLIYEDEANIPGIKKGLMLKTFLLADRYVGKYTDYLITLSEQETGSALKLGLAAPSKIKSISNGIALQKLAEIQRLPSDWEKDELCLGIAGRLASEKGHALLLNSFKSLADYFPSLKLKIAGSGPLKEHLMALSKNLGLEERVEFCGYQKDMVAFLRQVDIFVLSSHYEGFGLVLVEAMAAGIPVVATDVGGVAEVVVDGQTGLVVPPGQEDELAMGLEYFLTHRNLCYQFGQKGREHVMERFSLKHMVDEHLKIYQHEGSMQAPKKIGIPEKYVSIDLHMHSCHSFDSKTKIDQIIERAIAQGVKAISVTDHDNLEGSLEALRKAPDSLMIIPGMEITSDVGDIIALFIEKPIQSQKFPDLIHEIRAQNGLVYLPHPFRGRRSISLELLEHIDVFEVYNGRSQGIDFGEDNFGNREIVQFASGHQLTGIGGSDAHKPPELMRVKTWVPEFNTAEELKAILKSQQIFPIEVDGEVLEESLQNI
jgi:glycosyltransferase involved in cell wall biosynthesis